MSLPDRAQSTPRIAPGTTQNQARVKPGLTPEASQIGMPTSVAWSHGEAEKGFGWSIISCAEERGVNPR